MTPTRDSRRWILHGDDAVEGPAIAGGETVAVVPAAELERLREEIRSYVFNYDVDFASVPELMEVLDAPVPADSFYAPGSVFGDAFAVIHARHAAS